MAAVPAPDRATPSRRASSFVLSQVPGQQVPPWSESAFRQVERQAITAAIRRPPHRRPCLGRCAPVSAAPGRGHSCRSAGRSTSGRCSRQKGPRPAGRIQRQAGTGRQWMRQAGGGLCANPTAAGFPQARPTRRPAAVALQPWPPGRRSHLKSGGWWKSYLCSLGRFTTQTLLCKPFLHWS